jgi:dTDP-4-dehydrorhamnose 3,5-epimerase
MRFVPTELDGAWIIQQERHRDARGSFARTFCAREFAEHGLNPAIVQTNISSAPLRGTVRGMHWQADPAAETKLVRATQGALWDVIVDLREGSPTFRRWFGIELSAALGTALYVPAGFAHGFQTLAADTETSYAMSEFYSPEHSLGARYDDPAFGIHWPLPVCSIADRDLAWPAFAARARVQQPA